MSALIAWTIFAIGVGLSVSASGTGKLSRDLLSGLAAACLLWGIGVGLWEVVGVVV